MEKVINANVEATKGNKTQVEELKKWPLGQALLKAGFKPITKEQMRERFACDAIEKRANVELKAKAEKEGKEFMDERDGFGSGGTLMAIPRTIETLQARHERLRKRLRTKPKEIVYGVECTVEHESLNSYVQEEIPERCLGSVLLAIELGVPKQQLFVAYPMLAEVKQEDPIIIAEIVGKGNGTNIILMEIDFWE